MNSGQYGALRQGILLVSFAGFLSCGRPSDAEVNPVLGAGGGVNEVPKTETERMDKRWQLEERDYQDSVALESVLKNALEIARGNVMKEESVVSYKTPLGSDTVGVAINLGNHFSAANPHVIIRRSGMGVVLVDIYSATEAVFEKVLAHKQWAMEYVKDTVRDINGDGLLDFVVDCYGVNGCCLKAFSSVYLLRPDKKTFSGNFEFINPSFFPGEGKIRGVNYGHPGDTEMYTYKWNGEAVDTLEFVYYEKDDSGLKTGRIILSTTDPVHKRPGTKRVLQSVPAVYRKVEGYNWFSGAVLSQGR